MAEQWQKGDAVWGLLPGSYDWLGGTVLVSDSAHARVEFTIDVSAANTDLRRRDPAKKGKDKPTAQSEASR
jgi:hypothetical protein